MEDLDHDPGGSRTSSPAPSGRPYPCRMCPNRHVTSRETSHSRGVPELTDSSQCLHSPRKVAAPRPSTAR